MAPLGRRQRELLDFVVMNPGKTGRAIAETFGVSKGLARSTVLVMLECLRTKGYLRRRRRDGVFRYSPAESVQDLTRKLCADFVARELNGAVDPVLRYLGYPGVLSIEHLEPLRQLVRQLESIEADQANGSPLE